MLKFVDESLAPIASIVLIIGGGGGFKQMLVDTGVGNAIGQLALQTQHLADPSGLARRRPDPRRDRLGDGGDHHRRRPGGAAGHADP